MYLIRRVITANNPEKIQETRDDEIFLRSAGTVLTVCLFHLQGVVAADTMPFNGPREAAVKFVPAPPQWDRFLILVWQYQTDVQRDLDLYRQAGFAGFHIDYGAGQERVVEFAAQKHLPYYVDHAAGKGLLHLTHRTGLDRLPSDGSLAERPQSLVTSTTWDQLVSQLQANLTVTRQGPCWPSHSMTKSAWAYSLPRWKWMRHPNRLPCIGAGSR